MTCEPGCSPGLTPGSFALPPLPNTMFTRDSSAWLYGGVVLPPLFWHARLFEVSNVSEIYRHHPRFAADKFEFWYPPAGDAARFAVEDFGQGASLEGGDMMPIGNGTVLFGMGERTTGRMVEHVARALFTAGQADRIVACRMEQSRAYMHLDTVIGFVDRDAVTVYAPVVESMQVFSIRPGDVEGTFDVSRETGSLPAIAHALHAPELRVVPAHRGRLVPGRAGAVGRCQQRPGDRAGRGGGLCPQRPHQREPQQRRYRSHRDRRHGTRQGARRLPLHDVPDRAGRLVTAGAGS
jgi:arginine deiminase